MLIRIFLALVAVIALMWAGMRIAQRVESAQQQRSFDGPALVLPVHA